MITPVMPVYARADIAFERGEGNRLYSVDGRSYLDFAAGVAVNSLGHCHPRLVKALKDQSEKLWHCSNLYHVPGQERVARKLIANSFAETVFFCNSGAEALECVIKMTRKYHASHSNPERNRIIVLDGAFHGRTLATIAAGGQEKHLNGFAPIVDGFDRVKTFSANEVMAAITPHTAGILVEPIQGEGGIRLLPLDFLCNLRKVCDDAGILLAFDEVQTGIGRTGKFFAHQWADVTPDIMAIAKGLGGGFPVGAVLATEKTASAMSAGSHGSTFGGNPLAMSVAETVLDIVLEKGFFGHVQAMSELLVTNMRQVTLNHPNIISELRGKGLMLGLKTIPDSNELIANLRENGLLTVGAGDNVIRLLPPLTIRSEEIEEATTIMDKTFRELAA